MEEYRSHYQRLPANKRCIRLLAIHPGCNRDPLHIELQEHPVDLSADGEDLTPYEALSYVWGLEERVEVVKFGPGGLSSRPVTANLAEALHHLRYPDRPRTMWIDAVCIDQDNDEEKSSQVSIMGEIFHRAARVVAWLGLATDLTPHAIELFNDIGSQVDIVSWFPQVMRPTDSARDRSLGDDSIPLPNLDCDTETIMDLLHRPWFRRLWVRQEVKLARQAIAMVGGYSLSWANFRNTVFCLWIKTRNLDPYSNMAMDVLVVFVPGHYYNLPYLRQALQKGDCKDPRDKLYAVLSLLRSRRSLDIVPDYSISPAAIFRDAILKHLANDQNLLFLETCDLREQAQRLLGLNSWVPDWSIDMSFQGILLSTTAGSMFLPKLNYLGNGVLRLAGVECAEIESVEKLDTASRLTTLHSINNFVTKLSPGRALDSEYVPDSSFLDALCSLLLFNAFRENFRPPIEYLPSFEEMRTRIGLFLSKGAVSYEYDLDRPGLACVENIRSCFRGWHLLVTADKRIGAAVDGISPGDRIVLFPGSRIPIVLRPLRDGRFQVVGPCYLHGVMQGEPFLGPLPAGVCQIMKMDEGHDEMCYLDSRTGGITLVDPRFTTRGIDVSPYDNVGTEEKVMKVDARALEDIGVSLVDFDLV